MESFSDHTDPVDSLKTELRARSPWPVNFYVEYLEGRRFDDKAYENSVFETLKNTYRGHELDIVIARASPALQFALRHRDELFPGVPLVFWDVDARRIAQQKIGPGVTGVTLTLDARGTIDLALSLHPHTNTVAIVTENSEFERYWLAVVHAELLRHRDKVSEIDLVGLPTSRLLARVAALPPDTVVLFQEAPQGSVQPQMGTYDVLAWIGQRLPTYCILPELCLNHGGIGGVGADIFQGEARLAAELASRVLSGERPENIPLVDGTVRQVRVDWRQLRRWNIAESALPPGSLILNREPILWERYGIYIVAALVLIVVQTILIVGLLQQRARRQEAEIILRESEKRFRVLTNATPALIWMCDQEGQLTYANERRLTFTGLDPEAGCADAWTGYVHPDDLRNFRDALTRALHKREPFSEEYRLRRYDGVYRWIFDVASPRVNGDGSFGGFIGSAIDITDQKLAQEALQKLSGRLIEAQETERSRIARDLHDDISQKLALLSIELERATGRVYGSPAATKDSLEEIQQHCMDIAQDVQSLSHRLHYSKLDRLGAVVAIRSFCKELAKQHGLTIEFTDENVPSDLRRDISLCLFRVVQEALHNAVKYSGASQFVVSLTATGNEVRLVVRDGGAGFDLEEAKRSHGLGLASMQERMNLINGRLYIESRPGKGTTIIAAVPVPAAGPSAEPRSGEAESIPGAA
ncbi:MAG TPA: PAS domain S-box protein [Candidatus Cybelea sp.]|nr:PAS domain S-box protein [Candidatus Cybelea sp.]